ncbi:MAG: hypothetical protein QGG40_09955, partial [Myxococcota bacterium]|nr:hypothetical protein [Myxococcota bacterium]
FHHQDAENFYALLASGALGGDAQDGATEGSNPIDDQGTFFALIRVEDGDTTILKMESDSSYYIEEFGSMALSVDDGVVWGRMWWDDEVETTDPDEWPDPDLEVWAIDTDPLSGGSAGFYAYDAGGTSSDSTDDTKAIFGGIYVYEWSYGGDTGSTEPTDTGSTEPADTSTDSPGPGGDDTGSSEGKIWSGSEGMTTCTCDGTGGAAGGLVLSLLGVWTRRRRRSEPG